jgi:hypothetical protein
MNCFIEVFGPLWTEIYHALFIHRVQRDDENSLIRMGAVEHDLDRCMKSLLDKEKGLVCTIDACTESARLKKKMGDVAGAKKRLRERRRHEAQLTRIQNSISVVETHADALQGIELNKTIVSTLRASGHALKSLGLKGGMEEVDKIIMDVDEQLREANEITRAIGEGPFSQDPITERELDDELDLLDDPLEGTTAKPPESKDSIYERMPRVPATLPKPIFADLSRTQASLN